MVSEESVLMSETILDPNLRIKELTTNSKSSCIMELQKHVRCVYNECAEHRKRDNLQKKANGKRLLLSKKHKTSSLFFYY